MSGHNQAELWASWIEEIRLHARGLTKWEEDFIDSVAEQLEERKSISQRQAEILERIYAEKTR